VYDTLWPFRISYPLAWLAAVFGLVAPDGTEVNHTLCGARESWSWKVTVVPDGTVTVEGSKFFPEPAP